MVAKPLVVRVGGDEGEDHHQSDHEHGDRANPKRDFAVGSPEPPGASQPIQKPLAALVRTISTMPRARVAFQRSRVPFRSQVLMRMYQPMSSANTRSSRPEPSPTTPPCCSKRRSVLNVDTRPRLVKRTKLDDGLACVEVHAPPQHGH